MGFQRVDSATRQFGTFCHRHWHELKARSKTEGKVFAPLIQELFFIHILICTGH